jgi:hypothetical protein
MSEYIQLHTWNDWGRITYHREPRGNGPSEPLKLRHGDLVAIEWPDGEREDVMLVERTEQAPEPEGRGNIDQRWLGFLTVVHRAPAFVKLTDVRVAV